MNPVEQYMTDKLQERQLSGNLRALVLRQAETDFFSNDYLGLATHGIITQQLQQLPAALQATGSMGSRLLSGNAPATEQLEQTIAAFHDAEAALLFNSGYDANMGLITAITNRHTTILYDELCHASIIDGIRLSQCARHSRFKHNDTQDLKTQLQKAEGAVIVIAESIYSMDGDIAPLHEITAMTTEHHASLIVDEAHATGVFGKNGAGVVCEMGLQDKVFARVHTFGKALGCHGATVVGGSLLKQYLINFARPFIYTTALPPHAVSAIATAYQYLSASAFSNSGLHELIAYFREKIKQSGEAGWKDSLSSIQALVIGKNAETKAVATALQQAGLQVNPILHPTVPLGMERLRVCLHSFNTHVEIDKLFYVINTHRCSKI
jgi:8-amino-7-oxononanoate synthase